MIVDTSALVAVILEEPGHEKLLEILSRDEFIGVSSATLTEAAIVLTVKLGVTGRTILAALTHEAGITVMPYAEDHWTIAANAFVRYGKGRHPAKLNFGDCLTYAAAAASGEPCCPWATTSEKPTCPP
jgi:ribonuclease VapC